MFGFPKREPLVVTAVSAWIASWLLDTYGVQVTGQQIETFLQAGLAIAALVLARRKVTPVADPKL